MLTLKTISSGSSGNCYLLNCDNKIIILDCGLPIMEIKKGLNFDLSNVVGVCVSHGHQDHVKAVKDLKNMGFDVWQPYLDESKIQRRYFGGFRVQSFDVPHDDTPCCGFLIECPNGERLLYATDFEFIKYKFKKMSIHHFLIECNYQKELVHRDESNYEHVLRGHAEAGVTYEFIKSNLTDSLKAVILCHLSNKNSNAEKIITEVKKIVPWANVSVAKANTEVVLTEDCPF